MRLLETPKIKFWLAKKCFEVKQGETLEKVVEQQMREENLKFEIKNAEGRWEEVDSSYFSTPAALEPT